MAQAMCIEEDFDVTMNHGYIYYGETDSREKVEYSQSLRKLVEETAHEMHVFYEKRYIPKAEYFKNCTLCSLYEECRPRLTKKAKNVYRYVYEAEV